MRCSQFTGCLGRAIRPVDAVRRAVRQPTRAGRRCCRGAAGVFRLPLSNDFSQMEPDSHLDVAGDSGGAAVSDTLPAIQRVLQVLSCSLAQYAVQTTLWTSPGQESAVKAVNDLAADQRHYAKRVAELLTRRGVRPDPGSFPLEWMSLNDAGLSYAMPRIMEHHRRDIAAIERIADLLDADPEARDLAREVLGNAKAHAEMLAAAWSDAAS